MSQVLEAPVTPLVTTPRAYADYSLEQKAEVLALVEVNGNVNQVSRLTGIPHQTIRSWLDSKERFSELRTIKTGDLVSKLDRSAHELVDALQGKIDDASLAQTATALGIVIDKSQLLKNLPTSISVSVGRDDIDSFLASSLSDVIDVTPE